MDLRQLRCFLEAAETLHFGRAAQRLGILPAVLGRQIQALEAELRVRLFRRSTRQVAMTSAGKTLLPAARKLIEDADSLLTLVREVGERRGSLIRIGAIDSASTGLIPALLRDLQETAPDLEVVLVEDRTVKLVPKLLAGLLDLAFIRPPPQIGAELVVKPLLDERPLLALPAGHPLAAATQFGMADLAGVPMILADRRSRPHSHDLVRRLFDAAGVPLAVSQEAQEKHTILGLVAAGIGAAIVPRWSAAYLARGVVFRSIVDADAGITLPLAVAWSKSVRDDARDVVLGVLLDNLGKYAATA